MDKDKILVVDDEQLIFDSIEDTLEDDYQLYHAENGEIGLKMHAEHQPILTILDIRMPVMDGFEFLRHSNISTKDPYTVIVLSGHAVGSEISTCYEMGITAFLRKPFNVFELKGLVKQCIAAKKQYLSLLHEKQYVRAILDHSMDMIIALNDGFKIVEFNPAAERSFGYSALTMKGKQFKDLFADAAQFDAVEEYLSTERTFAGEVSLLHKNGGTFPAFLKLAALCDASGTPLGTVGEIQALNNGKNPIGSVGGIRDITLEKQLAQLQREKRDIEVVRVSVSTMKEQVRNRLNGLQLLRVQVEDIPEVDKQTLAIFDESIQDMTNFIDKLANMETFSTITVCGTTIFDIDGTHTK